MTSNQIAMINARETKRHNLYTEAETARANSLTYETNRRNQENQKEIAYLNNSTNLAIAEMNRHNAMAIAELNAATSRYNAEVSANAALNSAAINADTQRYVSSLNYQSATEVATLNANQRTFEANLKHQEFERSQDEIERYHDADIELGKKKNLTQVIGNVLNLIGTGAKAALLPLGL